MIPSLKFFIAKILTLQHYKKAKVKSEFGPLVMMMNTERNDKTTSTFIVRQLR